MIIGALAPPPINNLRNGKLSLVQGPLSMVNLQPLSLTAQENHCNTSQVLFQWSWTTSFSLWGHPVWRSFPGEVHGCHLCTSVPTHLSYTSAYTFTTWHSQQFLLRACYFEVAHCFLLCKKRVCHIAELVLMAELICHVLLPKAAFFSRFSGTEAFKTDTS